MSDHVSASLKRWWVRLLANGFKVANKYYTGSIYQFVNTLNKVKVFLRFDFFFWASSSFIHCLAALDFGAGVEQPFGCFILQNRQAVLQSVWRSTDWTLEDNMVDCLFLCATLTAAEEATLHLCKQERKRPTPVRRRLSRTHAVLGWVIPGGCTGVWNENGIVRPVRRTYVVVRKTDELCGWYKWVSRFEAPCICNRWTGERWVEQVSRLHGRASYG